jgi:hypothetical protein
MDRAMKGEAIRTLFVGAALLAAAPLGAARTPPQLVSAQGWRGVATGPDRLRIRDWRKTFIKALDGARANGHGPAIAAEGQLLVPDSALASATPPAGEYRCRTIKLGVKGAQKGDYAVYPGLRCRVAAREGGLSLAVVTGPQRSFGRLFPDSTRRLVFLGTLQLGDEQGLIRYGADEMRDMTGLVERIGARRWRLVLPAPHFESALDVVELIPAG